MAGWKHAPAGAPRIDRRELAGALLAGAGLIATGGVLRDGWDRAARAQDGIEATPPAPPSPAEGSVSYGPTIASTAASLGYDLDRIFRFVADEVRYEPYAGALRGPEATLWGLAGNAVDKAALLGALLDESQIVWRYAAGPLDAAAATTVLQCAQAGIADLPASYRRATDAALTPTATGIGAATPAATPASSDDGIGDEVVADVIARATFARQTIGTHFEALAGMLTSALDRAGVTIAPPEPAPLPDLEVSRHLWVQVADGPRWIDCDPIGAGIKRGTALGTASETFAAIPDDLQHMVSVRISAETLSGTAVYPVDAVSVTMTAAEAARAPIEIGVAPPSAMAAAGFAINDVLGGGGGCLPYLAAGDAILQAATTALPFSGGGGALGALDVSAATPAAIQDGDLVAISWTVEVTSPGMEPVSVTRYLLDRLSAAARASVAEGAAVDPAAIAPLELISIEGGNGMPAALAATTYLTVTTADLPGGCGYVAGSSDPGLAGIGSIGAIQAGLWSSALRDRFGEWGGQALVHAPQLAAFTVGTTDPNDAGASLLLSGDLLHLDRAIVVNDGADLGGIHPAIATGILAQVAEDIAVAPAFLGGEAAVAITAGPSVGRVFTEAEKAGTPLLVLQAGGASAIPDEAEPASGAIQAALDAGRLVVIPAAAVTLDGHPAIGWWEIDPATGRTVDVFVNGKGYAEARIAAGPDLVIRAQDAVEEAEILKEVNAWRPWYQRLGRCAGMAALVASAAVDPYGINSGTFSATGALKVALKTYQRNPNILRDIANLRNC